MAALFVVFHHAYTEVVAERLPAQLPDFVRQITDWLGYGQLGVAIFIVLSGYCLMVPVVREVGELRGGTFQYLKRRARRILPPYYSALLLSLLLIAIVPGMDKVQGYHWDVALPAFTPGVIISHLLLAHNLNVGWLDAIDPPMWSIATEWQIYFLLPLLLLPVWRRFGNLVTVAVAFLIGLFPHFAFGVGDFACPWFLGLFALGMAAASLNFRPAFSIAQLNEWSARFCLFIILVFLGTVVLEKGWLWDHLYIMDTLFGLAAASLLVFCTGHLQNRQEEHPFILKFLEKPVPVLLGGFSYSLYLVHYPVLSLFHLLLRPLGLSDLAVLVILLSAGVVISLLIAYLFHLLFERPFLSGPGKQTARPRSSTADSTAA